MESKIYHFRLRLFGWIVVKLILLGNGVNGRWPTKANGEILVNPHSFVSQEVEYNSTINIDIDPDPSTVHHQLKGIVDLKVSAS